MAAETKVDRLAGAYDLLLEQGYRPDPDAAEYVRRFLAEEDRGLYTAGCTDFGFNQAAVLTLEAFRLMNAGRFWGFEVGDPDASTLVPRLLRQAAKLYEMEVADRRTG